MIGAAVLVGMGLLMLAGVGYLAWVTVVHRLVDSPPAIVEVSKDTADKDKSDKDKAAKDKGKTDTTKPSAKDASAPDKNDKPSTDGGYDVADERPQVKSPPPVLPDLPIQQLDKPKDKKIDVPVVPIPVPAPPLAPGVTVADIDKAIERGVKYLKNTQAAPGVWDAPNQFGPGYACLAGLALLECKVPVTDPCIAELATRVRKVAGQLDDTYSGSLALLFLDKLGDPKDDDLIRGLGLRILAGQMATGMWSYHFPRLGVKEMTAYHGYLRTSYPWSPEAPRPKTTQQVEKPKDDDPQDNKNKKDGAAPDKQEKNKKRPKAQEIDLNDLPVDRIVWKAQTPQAEPPNPMIRGTDNSNTQFALLALWAARRHDVPAECPILLSYQHFRATQRNDGGWGYKVPRAAGLGGAEQTQTTDTMTCAGLLGLALGSGAVPEGSNIGDKEKIHEPVRIGLAALGRYVGHPANDPSSKPAMANMYFLWSVERVGVLYDLKTIGGKDWYGWGAQILLANQHPDGHWRGAEYPGASNHVDTCFALLFLKRANLVADLTENLKVRMIIRDPGAK